MSNFMGPMAPPQAAPSQPPQLDIRTNPNQRERFRDFMRQNTRSSMGMALPMAQPMMQPMAPAPMPMAPQAPRPPIPMAIRPNAPMMPQPMAAIDVFSPQYMNQPRPMRLEDGGSVPPRRTEIRGQDHMLSYITPDEADILKALGGSGEAGPMGIPTYIGDNEGGFSSSGASEGDMGGTSGNSSGNNDGGSGGTPGLGGSQDAGSGFTGPDNSSDQSGSTGTGRLEDADARVAAEQAAKDEAARDLVARTFATSNNKQSLVGAPNSKLGYVTTGKPSDSQVADALAAAKSLGMDISNVDAVSYTHLRAHET